MEVSLLSLDRALRLEPDITGRWPAVAFVGAGGKTTALFHLARSLIGRVESVLVTTTTHLGLEQANLSDLFFQIQSVDEMVFALHHIEPHKVALFTGALEPETKHLSGLSEPLVNQLWEAASARKLPLLIEADGARRKPLKAPAAHEPVIPVFTNLVVVCVGLNGLGKALDEDQVHRSHIFGELSHLSPGDEITSQAIARLLTHPQGGLKQIHASMQRVLLLNQADTPELEIQARWIAENVQEHYDAVLTGVLARGGILQVREPTAAIILAAGGARRFGKPKQLLEIAGEPMVRRSARLALAAGLRPVVIVCGAFLDGVKQALNGLAVTCVENPNWEQGQSTSLVAGVCNLPTNCGGVVCLLADQPFLSLDIILALVHAHECSLAPIVAPRVGDQRANPVYFDRVTFPEIKRLKGDIGGRALIQSGRYAVKWLEWLGANLMVDIGTPDDYHRWIDDGL